MRRIFRYKFEILVGAGIVLLYFFLRTFNLTIIPVFVDEAIYIRWAQIMENESTLRFLPLSDGKQPLFMWTVIPFLKIFEDPLVAGRMVSVVTGFGTLIGIFLLVRYLFKNHWAALAAAFIYTVSPFTVFFDRMALVDSMLTMFGVWVLLLGILTARTLRLDFAMLTGFTLGGALLTKSPALFYSLFLPLSIIFISTIKRIKSVKISYVPILKFVGLLLVTYFIGYAIYNILRLGPNFHLIGQRNQDYVLPLSHLWTRPLDPFIPYTDRAKEWLLILGPEALVILFLLGVILGLRNYFRETIVLLAWFAIPILAQAEFAKVITARYILFSLPPLISVASIVFVYKSKVVKNIALLGLLFFAIQSGLTDYHLLTAPEKMRLPQSERSGYLEEWTAGTGIREVADFIKERHSQNPNERIIIGTEGFFGTLPDGLQIYLTDVYGVTVIGIGITITEVPEQLENARKAGDTVYLVANSSRMLDKFERDATEAARKGEKLGLRVVASYPKTERTRKDAHPYLFYGERDILYLFEITNKTLSPVSEGDL